MFDEEADDVSVVVATGDVQRAFSFLGGQVGVCSTREEEGNEVGVSSFGGSIQRRLTLLVLAVDVQSSVEQHFANLATTSTGGEVECVASLAVHLLHLQLFILEKKFHGFHVTLDAREMQRRLPIVTLFIHIDKRMQQKTLNIAEVST